MQSSLPAHWSSIAPLPGRLVRVPRSQLNHPGTQRCRCALDVDALIPERQSTTISTEHQSPAAGAPSTTPSHPAGTSGSPQTKKVIPLTRCQLHELLEELPPRYQSNRWETIFDTDDDGFSFSHFYRTLAPYRGAGLALFLVQPVTRAAIGSPRGAGRRQPSGSGLESSSSFAQSQQQPPVVDEVADCAEKNSRIRCAVPPAGMSVIGAFVGQLPNLTHGSSHFFGGRETFVFRVRNTNSAPAASSKESAANSPKGPARRTKSSPTAAEPPNISMSNPSAGGSGNAISSAESEAEGFNPVGSVEVYRWGGHNEDFVVCGHSTLGFGGGAEGGAIYINGDLQSGTSSSRCPTFNSPPLCGETLHGLHQAEFHIVQMIWFSLETKPAELSMLHRHIGSKQQQKKEVSSSTSNWDEENETTDGTEGVRDAKGVDAEDHQLSLSGSGKDQGGLVGSDSPVGSARTPKKKNRPLHDNDSMDVDDPRLFSKGCTRQAAHHSCFFIECHVVQHSVGQGKGK
jgi:hypothetical protein